MSDVSPILGLPYIQASQAQKHVTHNESIQSLDAIVQLAVADRTLTVAPALPVEGERHIVAAGATGVWAGQSGKIALYGPEGWQFIVPLIGWQAHVAAEAAIAVYTGSAWLSPAEMAQQFLMLGINATPDTTNRLSVSAAATLLSHAGAGHQLKLNKNTNTNTASLLFQTGFSGRAEMGTAGNDDFSVKVSANGSSFSDALIADRTNGKVSLPGGVLVADGSLAAPGISFVADPDTGLRRPAANQIGLVAGGAQLALLSGAALQVDVPLTGTAVQSGPADSTAGRLMQVGAFGLGGADLNLTAITDLDALRTSGFHRWASGATGAPVSAGTVLHIPRLNGLGEGRHMQLAFGSTGTISSRNMDAVGGWNAWTTVHRSGQALAATTITGTGTVTLNSNAIGGTGFVVADDAVVGVIPPRTGGFASITCNGQDTVSPNAEWSCQIFFDAGSTLLIGKSNAIASVGTLVDVVTTNLLGTTGTDGRVTVAVQNNVIKVENRSGASKQFQITYA